MELRFTRNMFKRHVLRQWKAHLVPAFAGKPGIRCLQIGVFEGFSATWLLQHVLTGLGASYLGIDPYLPCFRRRENRRLAAIRAAAEHNLAEFAGTTLLIGTSQDVVPALDEGQTFDLIDIDGMHTYEAVAADVRNCWPRLRCGGIMICDDYGTPPRGDDPRDGVRRALDEFLPTIGGMHDVLWRGWQIAFRKF